MADGMPLLQRELSHIAAKARLSSAVDNVDKMIELLLDARAQISSCELTSVNQWPSLASSDGKDSPRSALDQYRLDKAPEPGKGRI